MGRTNLLDPRRLLVATRGVALLGCPAGEHLPLIPILWEESLHDQERRLLGRLEELSEHKVDEREQILRRRILGQRELVVEDPTEKIQDRHLLTDAEKVERGIRKSQRS